MNETAKPPETRIRAIPLSQLTLAPENARKTPPDAAARDELRASIAAHGLIGNLVVRPDGADGEGRKRYAVVAGGRRLAALRALAADGAIKDSHPVPCRIAPAKGAGELSLAENVARVAMHPADQVAAFSALAADGLTVSAIAARFGATERAVEQRLRLGNAAPELLEAYRGGAFDLETLKAFAITTDRERQLAAFAQLSGRDGRISARQVRRLLTEERVPACAGLARFVGVAAYEAAGGPVLRDLFADEEERGVWLEDPALLKELANGKLRAEAEARSKRWKWAEARIDIDWTDIARFGRVRPRPGRPTAEESAELERLGQRRDALADLDGEDWTDDLEAEAEAVEARLDEIDRAVEARARYRPEDRAVAGCIVSVGREGGLRRVEGLVRPEDMPEKSDPAGKGGADGKDGPAQGAAADPDRVRAPAASAPQAAPADPCALAREAAGVGAGLADDLRAVRTALAKAKLAGNFAAAFDLAVYQFARSVFARGLTPSCHALDITVGETADRPPARMRDESFGAASPGEALLEDWSSLPLDWLEADGEAASFAALRALTAAEKRKLFAAATARALKGQLSFEHGARPETEATIARLGIDFAGYVRPTADLFWSRLRKDRMLAIARRILGPAWAQARAGYRKADLARAMEEAFAAGPRPPGVDPAASAAALAWCPPGFEAFDPAADPEAARDAAAEEADGGARDDGGENGETPADPSSRANGQPDGGPPAAGGEAPEAAAAASMRRAG